jgi:hypothetical protein
VNVRDFGASGNGATDDTAAFEKAFDSIPATGAVLRIPAGTYRLSPQAGRSISLDAPIPNTLSITGKRNIHVIGDGPQTVLVFNQHIANGLRLLDCADSSLEAFKMVCTDPPGYRNNRHLIEIAASEGVRLENLTLAQSGGSGIYLDTSHHVEVTRCAISNATFDGITVAASRQVWIHDCQITQSRDHGIRVTWRGSICQTPQWVRVEKNHISDSQFGAGIALLSGDQVEVTGNEIRGGRLGGIAVYEKARIFSQQRVRLSQNHIQQSPVGAPTYVKGAINIWNLVCSTIDSPRIELTLEGNRFGDNVAVPIWVSLSNSSLRSLTLKGNTLSDGTPVAATFDQPEKIQLRIATYNQF